MIRIIDFLASLFGLILLSPVFLIIAIWIKLDDWKGPVFYRQTRVGKDGVDFGLYKFRSMYIGADKKGLITIGGRDSRITRSGYYIRKYKLDELPQFINVLKGDMSLVGPRPEVRKYVEMYDDEQRKVLSVRPGITDYASIEYLDENTLLALSPDPDKTYIEEIMPAKIRLNMKYINNKCLKEYLYVIFRTFTGLSLDKLFNWYFNKASLPFWGVLAMDIFSSFVASITSYAVGHGLTDTAHNFWQVFFTIAAYVPIFLVTGKMFHSYDIHYRYTSIVDLQKVCGAMISGSVIAVIVRKIFYINTFTGILSSSDLFRAAVLTTLLMMVVRIVIKSLYNSNNMGLNTPLAVVYGTSENVEILAQAIQNQTHNPYRVFAFLTDEDVPHRHFVMGKQMFKKDDSLVDMFRANNVEALICGPVTSKKINNDHTFVSRLAAAGIKVMVTPEFVKLEHNKRGKVTNIGIKQFEINEEDLLPREKIEVDMEAIGNLLHDKTVFISGAAGSIGSEMVRQIALYKPKMLLLVDQAESPLHSVMLMLQNEWPEQKFIALVSTITKTRQMDDMFKTHRPDYVFHAAAYKHVPMMEISPANAIQNNCIGTRVIADLSVKYGVKKFVMISTDKAVNPTNVMGCSKRICEIYCQALNSYVNESATPTKDENETLALRKTKTEFITTRFGNVLGSNGSVIPIFKEQIKNGGPVTVTHPDIVRYFMLIPEACKLVLQAGTMGHGGEIYAFDMGEPVRIADLAKRMIEISGVKGVKIEYTGLRDGEKLYEEVMNEAENTLATSHPKIRVAKVREYDFEHVRLQEKELEEISYTYDEMAIVKKMKEIVPEFKSQHSRFEVLD